MNRCVIRYYNDMCNPDESMVNTIVNSNVMRLSFTYFLLYTFGPR